MKLCVSIFGKAVSHWKKPYAELFVKNLSVLSDEVRGLGLTSCCTGTPHQESSTPTVLGISRQIISRIKVSLPMEIYGEKSDDRGEF